MGDMSNNFRFLNRPCGKVSRDLSLELMGWFEEIQDRIERCRGATVHSARRSKSTDILSAIRQSSARSSVAGARTSRVAMSGAGPSPRRRGTARASPSASPAVSQERRTLPSAPWPAASAAKAPRSPPPMPSGSPLAQRTPSAHRKPSAHETPGFKARPRLQLATPQASLADAQTQTEDPLLQFEGIPDDNESIVSQMSTKCPPSEVASKADLVLDLSFLSKRSHEASSESQDRSCSCDFSDIGSAWEPFTRQGTEEIADTALAKSCDLIRRMSLHDVEEEKETPLLGTGSTDAGDLEEEPPEDTDYKETLRLATEALEVATQQDAQQHEVMRMQRKVRAVLQSPEVVATPREAGGAQDTVAKLRLRVAELEASLGEILSTSRFYCPYSGVLVMMNVRPREVQHVHPVRTMISKRTTVHRIRYVTA